MLPAPLLAVSRALLLAFACLWSAAASAAVEITFHSFNGSLFGGRYPHTFVSLAGTMNDGTPVKENYGFSAKVAGPAVLAGPVRHTILTEEDRWLARTNRHFTLTMTDDQVRAVRAEMARWRDMPGKYYVLDSRNCIQFVGAMAQIMGLRVEYPRQYQRKPRSWLNHVAALNPQLGAAPIG